MSQNRGQSRSGEQSRKKKRGSGATGVRRFDMVPMQEAVFLLTPAELKDLLFLPNFEEDAAEVEDPDELISDEAEMEEFDDEESASDEQPRSGEAESILPAGGRPAFELTPVISPGDVYPLVVGSGEDGHNYCKFEAPNWMSGRIHANGREFISILRSFLYCLASWFEETKQDFLQEPTPADFVRNEDCRPDNCVVLQKGLLAIINSRMPEDHKMTTTYFNRLYDKIWLFWPEMNMPLSALFSEPSSPDFKKAWVIAGCIEQYRQTPEGLLSLSYEFEKNDYKKMIKRFEGLDPEMRLYVLSHTVGLASKRELIFKEIKMLCGKQYGKS